MQPPQQQQATPDHFETTECLWLTPRAALEQYRSGQIDLVPPQIMSLAHLARYQRVASAFHAARQTPPPLILPEVFDHDGPRIICCPGDPLHSVRQRALPGPTGEANLYAVQPREAVLCLADGSGPAAEADRLVVNAWQADQPAADSRIHYVDCCDDPDLDDVGDAVHYQDEIHRPSLPYKFKFKFSGCPNDCMNSIQRSDMAIIGTWRDNIRTDEPLAKKWL